MAITQVCFVLLRLLLAIAFVTASVTKLADRGGFQIALQSFAVPESMRAPAALVIPALEIGIGIGLLPAISA